MRQFLEHIWTKEGKVPKTSAEEPQIGKDWQKIYRSQSQRSFLKTVSWKLIKGQFPVPINLKNSKEPTNSSIKATRDYHNYRINFFRKSRLIQGLQKSEEQLHQKIATSRTVILCHFNLLCFHRSISVVALRTSSLK
jgi:hypothetical protein